MLSSSGRDKETSYACDWSAIVEFKRKRLDEDVTIGTIREKSKECTKLMDDCVSDHGWSLAYDGLSTQVWYRKEPATAIHTIRAETVINADVSHQ